ncbi:MAG: hypothetical protein ACXWD8_20300 [Mycobacterium sp.]
MSHPVNWIDRLRIERAVWALDQRLYDLPRKSRIAKRREVRTNLITAAHDVGTRDALGHLGDSRQLAAEYLSAELGDGPRHSWVAAAVFLLTAQLVGTSLLSDAALAFGDGVTAAKPDATGTFTWTGIGYLQDTVTYTFVDGKGDYVGGAWTPFAWAIWIIATVLVGRLWRVVPLWRRRHASAPTGPRAR